MADNPFRTEALVERRAEQRRQLRLIDPWIVTGVAEHAPFPSVEIDPLDRPLLEGQLRELADTEAAGVSDDLVRRMGDYEVADLLEKFLRATWKPGHRMPPQPMRPDVSAIVTSYEEQKVRSVTGEYPPPPEGRHLARLVAFSLWADELADDDYRDPRLGGE
jgi:hypothetical protein